MALKAVSQMSPEEPVHHGGGGNTFTSIMEEKITEQSSRCVFVEQKCTFVP